MKLYPNFKQFLNIDDFFTFVKHPDMKTNGTNEEDLRLVQLHDATLFTAIREDSNLLVMAAQSQPTLFPFPIPSELNYIIWDKKALVT